MVAIVKQTGKKPRVGDGTPGPGRKKGIPNKTTASVKEALSAAFDQLGGVPALVEWGQKKPGEFYGIWSKLIPSEIKAEFTGAGGGPVEIVVKYAGPPR